MEKQEKKGLAIGAVIGAVAGVITGILFAPKSGKETRQDIKNTAIKVNRKVQTDIDKIQKESKELIAKVELKAKNAGGKVSTNAKKHVSEAKHGVENLTTVVKSFKAGKASDKDLDNAIKQAKKAKDSIKAFLSS